MPEYVWEEAKNEWLRLNRGLSFEEVVYHITNGDLLDNLAHPNQHLHPGEFLLIVRIGGYAYEVPYYRTETVYRLMTVYPSRKYTREYLR